MNYLEDIYKLKHIKRYSNIPTIHEESVAEHGFFVASILFDLFDTYSFSLGDAMCIAVCHDMPEMELNDCPHVIKENYPEIAKAYDVCESRVTEDLPRSVAYFVSEYNAKHTCEAKIVELADIIQCIQYTQGEIKLGNEGYMRRVLTESLIREQILRKELKQYERTK